MYAILDLLHRSGAKNVNTIQTYIYIYSTHAVLKMVFEPRNKLKQDFGCYAYDF